MKSLFLLSLFGAGFLPVFFYIFTDPDNFNEITNCYKVISWNYISYHLLWLLTALVSFSLIYKNSKYLKNKKYIFNDVLLYKASITTFILSSIGYAFLFYLSKDLIVNIGKVDFISSKKELDLTGTGTPIILKHLHTAYSILYSYLTIYKPIFSVQKRRTLNILFVVGLLLDVVRSFGMGERLALMEYILPPIIFYLAKQKTLLQIKVIVSILILNYMFFTLAESTRSWTILQDHQTYKNVWQFGFDRMSSYYTTSINNSSLAFLYKYSGHTKGYYVMRGLYNTPILGKIIDIQSTIGEDMRSSWEDILTNITELSPEFNLFSAPGFCYLDMGYFGILVGFAWGALAGIIVRGAETGAILPTLFAPIWITSSFEISRTLYVTHEARVPTYCEFLVLFLFLKPMSGKVFSSYSKV